MQTAIGSFVLVDANTASPKVFWNGKQVPGVVDVLIDTAMDRVILKVTEDPVMAEMQAAGITIRRVV